MAGRREPTYPIVINTLGKLRDAGYGLYAHCTARYAGHGSQLDLDMLIERYGEDYVFINEERIAADCVCARCGHKGATLRLSTGSHPQKDRQMPLPSEPFGNGYSE